MLYEIKCPDHPKAGRRNNSELVCFTFNSYSKSFQQTEMKYLHELQNLVFVLTGQKLVFEFRMELSN